MKDNNSKKDRVEDISSIIFEIAITIAVLVCFLGMLYCFVSFCRMTDALNTEYIEVLQDAKSVITSTDDVDSSLDAMSDETYDKKNDMINNLITHMESIVVIQESSNKNSLMSFIYGLLSSILVGVCVVFVEKSRKNADEAKRNAEEAKRQAVIAEQKTKDTKKAIDEAHKAADQASDAGKIALESKHLVRLIIISSRIITAKSALLEYNTILANREITHIRKEIRSVFHDDYKDYEQLNELYGSEIGKIEDELYDLKNEIYSFGENCKKIYTDQKLKSMEIAANNYERWVKEAISYIYSFGENIRKPV